MTRQELINRVVQAYFNDEDWQGLLKRLVKELKAAQKDDNKVCSKFTTKQLRR